MSSSILLYSHDNLQKETSPIIYHLLKCTYHLSVTQGENRAGYVVGVNQNRFTTSWECITVAKWLVPQTLVNMVWGSNPPGGDISQHDTGKFGNLL